MNILWSIHLYFPRHGSGAESMARNINRHLKAQGHDIKILLHQANQYKITEMYEFEGVDVFPPDDYIIDKLFSWADVVISHLDYNKWTTYQCEKYGKKFIHIVHNDTPYPSVKDSPIPVKVVYNSEWCAKALNYDCESIIFPPPLNEWVKTEDAGRIYVTLINLNQNKGSRYFYSLAKKLPNVRFLGVRGSYDSQHIENIPNVKIIPNTHDIRSVYKITKILLAPSHYESWGMVASEAMANGIPVIYNPTPGLIENVGNAGICINRKETVKWCEEIVKLLNDPAYYKLWADKGLKRSEAQAPKWQDLERFICE
ncbi:MAG: glycosyltransferase family 4 protein [bacterium]|jgi:glycosyltransferase involved in cell wall biosynthesis